MQNSHSLETRWFVKTLNMRKERPKTPVSLILKRWKQLWDKKTACKQRLHANGHANQMENNKGTTDHTAINNRALTLGLHAQHLQNVLPKEPQAVSSKGEVDASLTHSTPAVLYQFQPSMKCH